MIVVIDSNNQTSSLIGTNSSDSKTDNKGLSNKVHDFFKSGTFKQGMLGLTSQIQPPNSTSTATTLPVATVVASAKTDETLLNEDQQLEALDQVLTEIENQKSVDSQTSIPVVAPTPEPVSTPVAATDLDSTREPISSEGLVGQSLPQALDNQANSNLNPAQVTRSTKEILKPTQEQALEANAGVQVVETEPALEISPEIESYLKRVDKQDSQPQKIIIADNVSQIPDTSNYKAQPMIVLPITPEIEKQARFKSPKFSIKWLVEWSRKIMKIFTGKVIYRQVEEQSKT